jgi:Family of unknown function (DUF6941)
MSEPLAKAVLLCTYASQDRLGRWNLMAVFDNLFVPAVPGQVSPFFIFVRVADCPKNGRLMFQVEDPAGMVLWTSGPQLYERRPEAKNSTVDAVFTTQPMLVTAFGKHRIAVYLNSDRVAETELMVAPSSEMVAR